MGLQRPVQGVQAEAGDATAGEGPLPRGDESEAAERDGHQPATEDRQPSFSKPPNQVSGGAGVDQATNTVERQDRSGLAHRQREPRVQVRRDEDERSEGESPLRRR